MKEEDEEGMGKEEEDLNRKNITVKFNENLAKNKSVTVLNY